MIHFYSTQIEDNNNINEIKPFNLIEQQKMFTQYYDKKKEQELFAHKLSLNNNLLLDENQKLLVNSYKEYQDIQRNEKNDFFIHKCRYKNLVKELLEFENKNQQDLKSAKYCIFKNQFSKKGIFIPLQQIKEKGLPDTNKTSISSKIDLITIFSFLQENQNITLTKSNIDFNEIKKIKLIGRLTHHIYDLKYDELLNLSFYENISFIDYLSSNLTYHNSKYYQKKIWSKLDEEDEIKYLNRLPLTNLLNKELLSEIIKYLKLEELFSQFQEKENNIIDLVFIQTNGDYIVLSKEDKTAISPNYFGRENDYFDNAEIYFENLVRLKVAKEIYGYLVGKCDVIILCNIFSLLKSYGYGDRCKALMEDIHSINTHLDLNIIISENPDMIDFCGKQNFENFSTQILIDDKYNISLKKFQANNIFNKLQLAQSLFVPVDNNINLKNSFLPKNIDYYSKEFLEEIKRKQINKNNIQKNKDDLKYISAEELVIKIQNIRKEIERLSNFDYNSSGAQLYIRDYIKLKINGDKEVKNLKQKCLTMEKKLKELNKKEIEKQELKNLQDMQIELNIQLNDKYKAIERLNKPFKVQEIEDLYKNNLEDLQKLPADEIEDFKKWQVEGLGDLNQWQSEDIIALEQDCTEIKKMLIELEKKEFEKLKIIKNLNQQNNNLNEQEQKKKNDKIKLIKDLYIQLEKKRKEIDMLRINLDIQDIFELYDENTENLKKLIADKIQPLAQECEKLEQIIKKEEEERVKEERIEFEKLRIEYKKREEEKLDEIEKIINEKKKKEEKEKLQLQYKADLIEIRRYTKTKKLKEMSSVYDIDQNLIEIMQKQNELGASEVSHNTDCNKWPTQKTNNNKNTYNQTINLQTLNYHESFSEFKFDDIYFQYLGEILRHTKFWEEFEDFDNRSEELNKFCETNKIFISEEYYEKFGLPKKIDEQLKIFSYLHNFISKIHNCAVINVPKIENFDESKTGLIVCDNDPINVHFFPEVQYFSNQPSLNIIDEMNKIINKCQSSFKYSQALYLSGLDFWCNTEINTISVNVKDYFNYIDVPEQFLSLGIFKDLKNQINQRNTNKIPLSNILFFYQKLLFKNIYQVLIRKQNTLFLVGFFSLVKNLAPIHCDIFHRLTYFAISNQNIFNLIVIDKEEIFNYFNKLSLLCKYMPYGIKFTKSPYSYMILNLEFEKKWHMLLSCINRVFDTNHFLVHNPENIKKFFFDINNENIKVISYELFCLNRNLHLISVDEYLINEISNIKAKENIIIISKILSKCKNFDESCKIINKLTSQSNTVFLCDKFNIIDKIKSQKNTFCYEFDKKFSKSALIKLKNK